MLSAGINSTTAAPFSVRIALRVCLASPWVPITGRTAMLYRRSIVSMVLIAALGATIATAAAFDDAMYPDWKGLWERTERSTNWDPTKPGGLGQQAPLIREYQTMLEATVADQKAG